MNTNTRRLCHTTLINSHAKHAKRAALCAILCIAATTGCNALTGSTSQPQTAADASQATHAAIQRTDDTSIPKDHASSEAQKVSTHPQDPQSATDTPQPDLSADAQETMMRTAQAYASAALTEARREITKGAYEAAISKANDAWQALPSDEAFAVGLYAASMFSPIDLMYRHSSATTDFEIAVTGLPRVHTCRAQNDTDCLAHDLPRTVNALNALGYAGHADVLSRLAPENAQPQQPLAAFLLPLSGSDRKIGRAMLGAALQAAGLYDHNGLPFAIRFFDTQSTPNAIPDILDELRKYNARLILGPLDIRETLAAAKSLGNQQVLIAFTPNGDFTQHAPAAFQFSYDMPQEAHKLAEFIVSNGISKITAAAPDDEYAASAVKFLQADLPANVALHTVTYPANQTDLRDAAQKVAKQSPELVYFPSTPALAERFASFLAQENIWCRLPGTPQPTAKADTRKFVSCLSSSAWAPVPEQHAYKFIVNGIYLDYSEAAASFDPGFAKTFESLYHRAPSVMEILPFVLLKMLAQLPYSAFQSQDDMMQAIQSLLRGQKFLLIPGFRQISEQSSEPYTATDHNVSAPVRTLVNAQ